MWSEVDPSMTLHALLGPRDRDNRFLSRFLKTRLSTRPTSGGGRDALTLSRSSSLSLWVARPEASCSSAYRQSTGAKNLEEPNFVGVPMSTRHSQRWRSWTTSVDIARPRDRAITFVIRGIRSGAVRSSFRTSGS